MNSIIFYSILLFIIISIFIPSIYTYAYSSFIGRILTIILILYFSKQNIFLGLIFITIVITYSYPLYEGLSMGKISIVTDNTKPNNINNQDDVYNYFVNYYCTNSNKPNRWQNILNNPNSSSNEYDVANYHMTNYNSLCTNNNNTYYNNYYTALDQQEQQWSEYSWYSNNDLQSHNYDAYSNLYSSIFTPIDACSQNNNPSTNVYNTPQCLFENVNAFACNNSNVINQATNVSNNFNLDINTQQDGQFIINTNNWICQ